MIPMHTRLYKKDDLLKEEVKTDIKETLLSGKNVVFPTETVYGIGANALSQEGIENIYRVKGRPSDNPLIMHIASQEDVTTYAYMDTPYVKTLMDTFWPGPLTLVMRRKSTVPDNITGGLETVGIRLPSNDIARKIISIAGVPICAPSANISGRPSSTLLEHVLDDFDGLVDIIIDGGKAEVGLESTVLDATKKTPVILRPGIITKSMLETVVDKVDLASYLQEDDIPQAPGMKYKHYAPSGEMTIVEGVPSKVVDYINKQIKKYLDKNHKVGVIVTSDLTDKFKGAFVVDVGEKTSKITIASNLYIALRKMNALGIDYIYSLAFHENTYQEAIMNRLYKAANHTVIKV